MKSAFSPADRVPGSILADPLAAIPELRAAWEAYQENGVPSGPIRPAIVSSWSRSRDYSVSPDRRAADIDTGTLGAFESHDQVRRLLVQAWRPMKVQLGDALSGSDSAVVICDDGGRILDRGGDPSILRVTEAQNFVPGSVWSEEGAGTNGIGLVLAVGRPAQVFSAEHFCVGFQGYACTAAPVRHPVTRHVIGVLDVTTCAKDINPHTFAMIVHAARDMEREMEEHVFGRERELLERYLRGRVGLHVPFFTVDRSGRTIIQNAAAAQMLSGEDLLAVLTFVQEALKTGTHLTCDLELAAGDRVELSCHVVHAYEDVIGALVALQPLRRAHPSAPPASPPGWQAIVGRSPAMRELFAKAARVAARCVPVVIDGEPGTGKLTLAKTMHARSPCASEPVAAVNFSQRGWRDELSAVDEARTLILLRIAALSEAHQLELAAIVEQLHEQDVWTIAIVTRSDRPLRLELLHRLSRAVLPVPPLRERIDDLDLIVADWCRREAGSGGSRPMLSPAAMGALRAQSWPGNVRELLNTLGAARLQCRAGVIGLEDLALPHGRRGLERQTGPLREVERAAIEQALGRTGGNISRAAELLGISRATLYRRLREYRLLGR